MTRTRGFLVATVLGVLLVGMTLADLHLFPDKWLGEHSVISSLASSLLLVGVVFFAYEGNEKRREEERSGALSGAGLGGIVNHMVDVELALAIAGMSEEGARAYGLVPSLGGKPLNWVQPTRVRLDQGLPQPDPRLVAPLVGTQHPQAAAVLDQSIRRILAGMRDWTPLIGASSDGTEALLLLSDLRGQLMELGSRVEAGLEVSPSDLSDVKVRTRVLAVCFEQWSGSRAPRHSVLVSWAGLDSSSPPASEPKLFARAHVPWRSRASWTGRANFSRDVSSSLAERLASAEEAITLGHFDTSASKGA